MKLTQCTSKEFGLLLESKFISLDFCLTQSSLSTWRTCVITAISDLLPVNVDYLLIVFVLVYKVLFSLMKVAVK